MGNEQMQATQEWGPEAVPTPILLRKGSPTSGSESSSHPPAAFEGTRPVGMPALHGVGSPDVP